jgi:4-amino-4-deoxy-L-arabinose transferase-like glycosyltransferase
MTLAFSALGLTLRLAIVFAWGDSFPPADDGTFYHVVAQRIAQGLGYTWAWPDGAVTYAAHYPVGYAALIGSGYALFGSKPLVAMVLNALVGTLAVVAGHRLLWLSGRSRAANLAALLLAVHPTLVAYTLALMTEGVVAALLLTLVWFVVAARSSPVPWLWYLGFGFLGGLLTLIRPQVLPLLGISPLLCGGPSLFRRALVALKVVAIALLVCAPWTLRNCEKLGRCSFVSANGGWNLLIGTAPEGRGGWVSLDEIGVPLACREVFAEADKDKCFAEAALREIEASPLAWLALAPQKLSNTFDYGTSASYYLGASNALVMTPEATRWLGALEVLFWRVALLLSLARVGTSDGRLLASRRLLSIAAAPFVFLPMAWPAVLAVAGLGILASDCLERLTAATLGVTALTHVVFFGAARYSLPTLPLLTCLSAVAFVWGREAWQARFAKRLVR